MDRLTIQDVADYLKVKPRTIKRWREAGKFCAPDGMLPSGKPLWKKESIDGLLEAKGVS